MRFGSLASLALVFTVACRAADPVRALTVREVRLAALDSMAQRAPCRIAPGVLRFAPEVWQPTHACALATRAVALLTDAPTQEPYAAPGDTAHVRAIAIWREQSCGPASAHAPETFRLGAMRYVVEIEVAHRPYSIVVPLTATGFVGPVLHDVHPRGSMGSPVSLAVPPWDSPDTLAEGAPCPDHPDAF